VIATAIGIAAFAAVLTLFALMLPPDGTRHVLELRDRFGGADDLDVRRDRQSSVRHIALRNSRGEVLTTAWVRRPLVLDPRYRILITYAGADTGDAILKLIPAKDDLVVVALQYPWKPPHTLTGKARALYDIRQAAYRAVAGGILAVDFLAREHLDTRRILLLGASLGSIFATMHGAIDHRVPEVVLIHGGADLSSTLDAEIRSVPAWLRPPLVRIARIPIDTFDPAHYVARIAPRRLLVIAARDDWRFPAAAVVAFFDRAGQPKELRWTNTGHVGKRNRRVVDAVIAELNAYLAADQGVNGGAAVATRDRSRSDPVPPASGGRRAGERGGESRAREMDRAAVRGDGRT
jgi:dienelactone hydrolase